MKQKKHIRIKPKFIKNAQNQTIQVYLDIKSYESMLSRMQEFEAIKKSLKSSSRAKK